MKELTLHFTKVNNITTSIVITVPNNLSFILSEVKYMLKEYPEFLFCRFEHAGSNYQVDNKNFNSINLKKK